MKKILNILLIVLGIGSLLLIVIMIFIGTVMGKKASDYNEKPTEQSQTVNRNMEFDLEKTLKTERRDMIVMGIDTYLNDKSEYGEKIEKLNLPQRTFLFVENLEREINNGGFNQFYFNSSGDFSEETVNALLEIGANKTAEIIKKANSEFKDGIVPKDRTKRQNELEQIEEKAEENWNKCNSEFYEYQDDLTELLIAFVIKNKAEFKK